jgi:hypothetical protein
MVDESKLWRDRLRQALLDELAAQEMRAGCRESVARIIARRRLAAAAQKARQQHPPELHELPPEVQAAIGLSRRQRDLSAKRKNRD